MMEIECTESVEGVEHVEEDYAEEPEGYQQVVDCDCYVLFVLLDLDYEGHRMHDQYADKGHPG